MANTINTVKELRKALEGIADDTNVVIPFMGTKISLRRIAVEDGEVLLVGYTIADAFEDANDALKDAPSLTL